MSDVPVIISRKEARAKGLKRYFTGKPCAKGHLGERFVNAANCVECDRAHKAANRDKIKERDRAYRAANRERRNDRDRARRATKTERDRENAQKRAWKAAKDPFEKRAWAVNFGARERGAPGRLTGEHIRVAYFSHVDERGIPRCANRYLPCSNALRDGYHVDHIKAIDLGGENVPENIQCLCPSCSSIKGNKTEEEFKALVDQDRDRYLADRAQKRRQLLRTLVDEFGVRPSRRRPPPPSAQLDLFRAAPAD
jgi:5-methylcytosine-specific restriction endonuclease McrA